jgi:hypothetical protein
MGGNAHQFLLAHHQNGSVPLQIDALSTLYYLEAFDCDVFLVGEAEADKVEHFGNFIRVLVGINQATSDAIW